MLLFVPFSVVVIMIVTAVIASLTAYYLLTAAKVSR